MARAMSSAQKGSTKVMGAIVGVGLLVTVAAILFGQFDDDVIDVSAAIVHSNEEKLKEDPNADLQAVPTADPKVPNGGLVGTGGSVTPPPPVPQEAAGTTTEGDPAESSEEGDSGEDAGTDDAGGDTAGEGEAPTEESQEAATETVSEDAPVTQ